MAGSSGYLRHGNKARIWLNSVNIGKIADLETMVSVYGTTLLGPDTIMRTSCFDTDFASLMKLTKLPLIGGSLELPIQFTEVFLTLHDFLIETVYEGVMTFVMGAL